MSLVLEGATCSRLGPMSHMWADADVCYWLTQRHDSLPDHTTRHIHPTGSHKLSSLHCYVFGNTFHVTALAEAARPCWHQKDELGGTGKLQDMMCYGLSSGEKPCSSTP